MTLLAPARPRRRDRPAGRPDEAVDAQVRVGHWVPATFAGLAVIAVVGMAFSLVLGLALAALTAGVLVLLLGRRDTAPLWQHALVALRYRLSGLRGDDPSPGREIRPWPHVAKMPAALAGTELLDADHPGAGRCGVVWHKPTGLTSVTALLAPSDRVLSDPAVAEAYAACWWGLLEAACSRTDVQAAAVTLDVLPGGGPQPAVRFTLTVDPTAEERVTTVSDAAALTVRALLGVDAEAAGVSVLRPATAEDLARIARAAFEPRARIGWPGAEPPAWGELSPATEADLATVYQHECYCSASFATHSEPGGRIGAETVPQLLAPARFPRRVTLVRCASTSSVFVTVSVADPDDLVGACEEVASAHPGLELCRHLQAEAFGVGLPAGWFPPHPVPDRDEVVR
jgi:hypothetical protein